MRTPYDDIIHLPHHVPAGRRRMPLAERAAQFAPFAALTGHDEAIAETARKTDCAVELSADQQTGLSRRLTIAMSLKHPPVVSITYFVPDEFKPGGCYVTATGRIKRVEPSFNSLILDDSTSIRLDSIIDITGDIFE